jgi:hypothetical protein
VTEHSDALSLDKGVFTLRDPERIAASLKRSAERSSRRKSSPFRSALSMLTFYINRAGKNLPASRKKTLMRAKDELRKQFGKAWEIRVTGRARNARRNRWCAKAAQRVIPASRLRALRHAGMWAERGVIFFICP